MLLPSQLQDLKTKDPKLFALLRTVVDAMNNFGIQMGIDPRPAPQTPVTDAIPGPPAPKGIDVVSIAGAVLVKLTPGDGTLETAYFFVEQSSTPTFQTVTVHPLGHGLSLAVPSPAGTTYWRAYAKYLMSQRSGYIVWSGGGLAGAAEPVQTDALLIADGPQTLTVDYTQTEDQPAPVPQTTIFNPAAPVLDPGLFTQVGQSVRISARGYFTNPVLGPALKIRANIGSCLIETDLRQLKDATSPQFWEAEAIFTCRELGSSGRLAAQGKFHYTYR